VPPRGPPRGARAMPGTDKETLVRRMERELQEWSLATQAPQRMCAASEEAKGRINSGSEAVVRKEEATIAGLLQQIEACNEAVAAALNRRDLDLVRCQEDLNRELNGHDLIIAAKKCAIDETRSLLQGFQSLVGSVGLDGLGFDAVQELLHILGVPMRLEQLKAERLTGAKLGQLTEAELARVCNLSKVGACKRLAFQLRMLANGDGFLDHCSLGAGVLGWDTEAVCDWLHDAKLLTSDAQTAPFIRHGIDGVALVTLEAVDLELLGVRTAAHQRLFVDKVATLKTGGGGDERASSPSASAGTDQKAVLDAVLRENSELQQELDTAKARFQSKDVPDEFLCPITLCVMTSPVFAMDGNTYERAAIESWFKRNSTSPLSGTEIEKSLVPNLNLRRQISAYK